MAQNEGISISDPEETVPGQVQPARPVGSTSNVLSIAEGRALMSQAEEAITDQDYNLATEKASGGSTNL